MPTGKHLSHNLKIAFIIGAVAAVALGILISQGYVPTAAAPAAQTEEPASETGRAFVAPPPTDTVRVGTVTFDTPGLAQDTLYLVYEEPGQPALTTRLIIDEHSYCNIASGGLPCMAMSVQYSSAFGGKRALVDGNTVGDTLIVRRLRVLDERESPRVMDAGTVYVPWTHARAMILDCGVQSLMQSHEGLVFMTTKEGARLTAVEPVIDDVFSVAHEATAACGSMQLGTE